MPSPNRTSELLEATLTALREDDWRTVLDELPVPVYTTDGEGAVTYWNKACVDFAGRQPQVGRDNWCVTWQLYTATGDRLPHENCPMAEAIRKRREVRGEIAIALRPDGTRRAFMPYPTPLFDASGALKGAVNLLIDVTDQQAVALSEQAERCKRLSKEFAGRAEGEILADLGGRYAAMAAALKAEG